MTNVWYWRIGIFGFVAVAVMLRVWCGQCPMRESRHLTEWEISCPDVAPDRVGKVRMRRRSNSGGSGVAVTLPCANTYTSFFIEDQTP